MKPKIGFIGVGIMGRHMASHLLEAGYQVVAYDAVPEATDFVVDKGAERGGDDQVPTGSQQGFKNP